MLFFFLSNLLYDLSDCFSYSAIVLNHLFIMFSCQYEPHKYIQLFSLLLIFDCRVSEPDSLSRLESWEKIKTNLQSVDAWIKIKAIARTEETMRLLRSREQS
jgi:hypothetical protein